MSDTKDNFDFGQNRFGKLRRTSPKYRKSRKLRHYEGSADEIKFLGIDYAGKEVLNPDGSIDPEYPYVVFVHTIYGKMYGAVRALDIQNAIVAAQEIYHEYNLQGGEIRMSDGVTQIFNIEAEYLTYCHKIKYLDSQKNKESGKSNVEDGPPDSSSDTSQGNND